MENSNTKQTDRQEKCLVEQLNCGCTAYHAGIGQPPGISRLESRAERAVKGGE